MTMKLKLSPWLRQAGLQLALMATMLSPSMAEAQKVSALPNIVLPNGSELVPCVSGGVTKSCRVDGTLQGLDLTGATDQSAKITAALAAAKTVKLPPGVILASFTVPSNVTVSGAGQCVYNRTSLSWSTNCTLILGTVTLTGSQNATLTDMAIDAYAGGADAIDAKSDATTGFIIRRVSTRANNHNILLEKNANTGNPTTDALGANVNNGLIEDVILNGGPNGLAVKMRGIVVRRATAYDITGQAFPVVSDVINGATTYSRAQDVTFYDSRAVNSASVLHVYSRDNFSPSNADGVQPAKNIRWIGGSLSGATSTHGADIGDSTANDATIARIPNQAIWIIGADIRDNNQHGIFWEDVNGGGYTGCTFGNNGLAGGAVAGIGVNARATSATNVTHGPSVVETGQAGLETGAKSFQASTTLSSAFQGLTLTNYLASAGITFTLPPISAGAKYRFVVSTAQAVTIVSAAPSTNFIYNNGAAGSTNIANTGTRGATLVLEAEQSSSGTLYWVVTSSNGTWTLT